MENYPMGPMNPMMDPAHQMEDHAERMERMYPETYAMLNPHVKDMVDSMTEENLESMNGSDMARMTEEALHRSGLMNNMPAGHNAGTLNDLARTIAVRHVIDRRRGFGRRGGFPFVFPFFFYPSGGYDGWYDGWRDGYPRRHGHEYGPYRRI